MEFEINYIDGIVRGYSKNTKTHIQGNGGGGYIFDGYGYSDPIRINSSQSTSTHFFLEYNGGEVEINLNQEINLRENQNIRLLAILNKKTNSWDWIALKNFNTQTQKILASNNDLLSLKILQKKALFNSFPSNLIKILYFIMLALLIYSTFAYASFFRMGFKPENNNELIALELKEMIEKGIGSTNYDLTVLVAIIIALIPLFLVFLFNIRVKRSNKKITNSIFKKIKTINQIT